MGSFGVTVVTKQNGPSRTELFSNESPGVLDILLKIQTIIFQTQKKSHEPKKSNGFSFFRYKISIYDICSMAIVLYHQIKILFDS